jgi:nucleotide-binding universal stress UspA family protein
MKKILLPFDGSKPARRALDYVVQLREEGLKNLVIHVVNVQEEPKLFGDYASQSLVEKLNSEAKLYGETVNKDAIKQLQSAGIEGHSHEVIGGIAEAIVHAAGDIGCAPSSWARGA